MKTKKLFSVLIIAIVAILMLTAILSTVQAVDAAPKKVKVTWNANGGKIGTAKIATTTVKKGVKIGKLPKTPKKTGYVFSGWYTKKSGGIKVTTATKIKSKKTFYAQWKKQYILTFNPNGGTITTKTKKLTNKQSYGSLPTPTRSDYTFTGWYTAKTGGKKVSTTTKMVAKGVTVYAQWKKGSSTTNTPSKRSLSENEKKLVGKWGFNDFGVTTWNSATFSFAEDGTYYYLNTKTTYNYRGQITGVYKTAEKGSWSISGGTVYFTERKRQIPIMYGSNNWDSLPNNSPEIHGFDSDEKGQYFLIGTAKYYKS